MYHEERHESYCDSPDEDDDGDFSCWSSEDEEREEEPTRAAGRALPPRGERPAKPPPPKRVVQAADPSQLSLADLPPPLLRALLALVPADMRLRCREVCPGWRDALAEKALWAHIDISDLSGVAAVPTDALLRALSAASGHTMIELQARNCGAINPRTVLRLVYANAHTLRTLVLGNGTPTPVQLPAIQARFLRDMRSMFEPGGLSSVLPRDLPEMRRVATAGQALELLLADIRAHASHAVRLLHNEFGALRVRRLTVQGFNREVNIRWRGSDDDADDDEDAHEPLLMSQLADALPDHPSLRAIDLVWAQLTAGPDFDKPHVESFGRLCEAIAEAPHVNELTITESTCCDAALHHIGRLLQARTLEKLQLLGRDEGDGETDDEIDDDEYEAFEIEREVPFALVTPQHLFCTGLRASSLTCLVLNDVRLFDTAAGAAVVTALVGHPTLRVLHMHSNHVAPRPEKAISEALGALLAADTLVELDISGAKLTSVAVAPLVASLAATTRLHELGLNCHRMSSRFLRQKLTPAVRSSRLRKLSLTCECDGSCDDGNHYQDAEALTAEVTARAAAELSH